MTILLLGIHLHGFFRFLFLVTLQQCSGVSVEVFPLGGEDVTWDLMLKFENVPGEQLSSCVAEVKTVLKELDAVSHSGQLTRRASFGSKLEVVNPSCRCEVGVALLDLDHEVQILVELISVLVGESPDVRDR